MPRLILDHTRVLHEAGNCSQLLLSQLSSQVLSYTRRTQTNSKQKLSLKVYAKAGVLDSALGGTVQRGDGSLSWYVHYLDGLQHVAKCNHQVTRLDHAPGLEQGEGAVQVALHIVREAEAEGGEAPLKVQPSPHGS